MNRFLKILIASVIGFSSIFSATQTYAFGLNDLGDIFRQWGSDNLDIQSDQKAKKQKTDVFTSLDDFAGNSTAQGTLTFFGGDNIGELGAYNLTIQIAKSLKDVFMLVAVIYLMISVLKLLFGKGGDDDAKKWKGSILWTTVGIIVMQSAFIFVTTLFNKKVNGTLADAFLSNIIYPFTHLLELLAAFVFLAMAFISFFRMVTAGGNDEAVKKGKQGIVNGIIGFLIIKIPGVLVASLYGSVKCETKLIMNICKVSDPNISQSVSILTTLVNYLNGFLAIVIVLLIVYSGFLVITSAGDEKQMGKVKNTIMYIFIGMFLLFSSYALFNFFLQRT